MRNVSGTDCHYNLYVDLEVDGKAVEVDDYPVRERPGLSLRAGETAVVQLFDLDEFVTTNAAGKVTSKVTPKVTKMSSAPLLVDYYDMEYEMGESYLEGADLQLSVIMSIDQVAEGMPERLFSAQDDGVLLQGLDAAGRVVIQTGNTWRAVPLPVVDEQVWFALGGGNSSGYGRNLFSLQTMDEVEQWRFHIQPVYTELAHDFEY